MKDQPARCTYNRAFAFDVLVKDLWSRFDPGWRIRVPGEMNEPSQRIRRYFGRAGEKLTVSRKIR